MIKQLLKMINLLIAEMNLKLLIQIRKVQLKNKVKAQNRNLSKNLKLNIL